MTKVYDATKTVGTSPTLTFVERVGEDIPTASASFAYDDANVGAGKACRCHQHCADSHRHEHCKRQLYSLVKDNAKAVGAEITQADPNPTPPAPHAITNIQPKLADVPLPDIESSETIPAGKAQTGEPGCNYCPLSLLAKRYRDILFAQGGNPLNPETGGAYLEQDSGKATPITGGVAEIISPANLPQTTPDAPAVVTPPESGFGQDAFAQVIQENEAKGIHGIVFAGIALLPAGIGGVHFWKKRKGNGTQDYLRRVLTFCPDR